MSDTRNIYNIALTISVGHRQEQGYVSRNINVKYGTNDSGRNHIFNLSKLTRHRDPKPVCLQNGRN